MPSPIRAVNHVGPSIQDTSGRFKYLLSRVTQRLHEQAEDEDKKKGLQAYACNPFLYYCNTGAADRNRTGDLRITNALLYRLSYSGETCASPSIMPDKQAVAHERAVF